MQLEMYPAQANSPQTELAAAIDSTQTTITLVDASVVADAPNLLTIGIDEWTETVLYTEKDGNDLKGVSRGFQGTVQSWALGTKVARYFTAYDHNAFSNNIESISADIEGLAGDGRTTETVKANTDAIIDVTEKLADMVTIGNYMTGTEYLYPYHEKLRTKQAVKVIFSGDSTTSEGPWVTDKDYLIHNIASEMLIRRGVRNATCINAGHSNMRTTQWESIYLAEDLAQNPDLYIWRWGLNDGSLPLDTRLQLFTDALRGGLTTLRAQYTANQLSVVLMMPNSTNDSENGRDKAWFDLIYPVIFQAARDYQCCFVDTYNYLLDSTNVTWQDEPMGVPGVHIHPLNTGNAWIASLLEDILVPAALRDYGVYVPTSTTEIKYPDNKPSTYPVGFSAYRTFGAWPHDGGVTTVRYSDGMLWQINNGLWAKDQNQISFRVGLAIFGLPDSIGDDAWGPWVHVRNSEPWQNLTLENSWVNYGTGSTAQYKKDAAGNSRVKARIKNGTIAGGTVLATLPIGYRPIEDFFHVVSCGGAYGLVEVKSNGQIVTVNIPSGDWVDFGNFSFPAEL